MLSNGAGGTYDVRAGVADGSLDAGVDAEVVLQEHDLVTFDDSMRVRFVAILLWVDQWQRCNLRGRGSSRRTTRDAFFVMKLHKEDASAGVHIARRVLTGILSGS